MGHKWAQNVPDLIGGGTYATLASRILGLPGAILVNIKQPGGFVGIWFEAPPGMAPELVWNPLPAPNWPANFPYGIAVEPDAPT